MIGSDVLDPQRLAALHELDILDTAPEPGFDDIVKLATRLCNAPVALVSLVDRDRQWFKAREGFSECQTDLGASVCALGLASPDLFVITDLAADPRTQRNPLVAGNLMFASTRAHPCGQTPATHWACFACWTRLPARPA